MNLKSFNGSARRRGTTIAAAALSVAMVAPFVHPIASPQTAAVAQAQESDAPASNANVIEADAIANGYIGSATDMTNAKSTLSGRAYIDDGSGFGPTDAGNLPVPEGTTVYMQWIDKDGAVSPVYSAKTSNQLSSDKTSQAGPGAYAFDLREPWTDVHGKDHTYTASAKQYYKLWINPFTDERNGATVVPFRQVGGFFPGAFMNSAGASQQGAWNTIGTNMQRTSVLMQNEGDTSYMHKPKAEWVKDTEETLPNQSGNLGMKNHVGGRVWLETRDVRVDGPDMTGSDVAAAGFNVVMSVLTPEGIGEYAAKVETLPLAQQQAAAKQLLEEHPEYIAETVTTKVGEDGYYSVKFSDGKLTNESKKYLYAHVESPDGKPMIGYSGWRLPLYQSPTANGARNPNPIAAQNLVANPMWYNVNFALVPRHNVSLDITNYDMTENPARPGDMPALDVKGPFPVTPNKIVWKKNGEEFKTCEGITSEAEANKCVFVVPEDAVKGDVFTAEFVTGDNTVIAADSFVVTDKPYAEELEPEYGGKKVVPGTPVESEPTFKKQDENGNVTDETVKTPEGSKFSIPDDFKVPEGYTVDIDESTGKVTVDADPEKLNKDTVEEFEVPVTVEYPDGSKDDAKAKFELDTDGDGTPDSKDDDDDGDGVSDEDEKDKGTNPKDKGEFPATPLEPGTKNPDWDNTSTTPDKPVEIPNTGGSVEDGTTVETEGPGKAELGEDGTITVTPSEDAKPGDKVVVEVKDPEGKVIDTVEVEIEEPAKNPDWDNTSTTPDKPVEIPNTGGSVEDGTTVETEGPGKAELGEDGTITVTPSEDAKPGDKVVVEVKDPEGKVIDTVEVEIEEPGKTGNGSCDLSSKPNERCINTGLGVGIPLLFLIPVGLASQMNIPGLSDFVAPINKQIRDLNTQLQKQAGVFNGPLAGKMAGIDAQLKRFGVDHQQAAGAVALIAAGALAIGLIADACAPGAGSSNGSSK